MAFKKRAARKKVTPRAGLDRPFNGSTWTAPRMRQFIMSALRKARWPQKFVCINACFVGHGTNPKTGRKCKLHRCPQCQKLFPQNQMAADHIFPVVSVEGFVDWNTYIERLFVEGDMFMALCKDCHKKKTDIENEQRRLLKKKDQP